MKTGRHKKSVHKQAGEASKPGEMYYRLLFEHSADAILLAAPDGSIYYANPAACRMLQRTEAEICSLGRNVVIDPTDPRLPAALEERERTGRFKGELTCLRSDGQKFPCELSSVVFTDQDGQLRTSVIIHDLTEHKKLEEELRESQRFTISTINALAAHIAVLDEKGIILAVNHSWRNFAEDNPPVFVNVNEGANYLSVCDMAQGEDSEIAAMFAAGIRSVISGKREMFSLEYPCHSPDKKRWFTGRAARFSGPGPIRVVVAHEDITERKLTEIKLLESGEKYRNIFNDAILGIYQTTPEGRILSANPALARMYGYDTPEALINDVTATQMYVNPEDREIFKRILSREGVVEKFEVPFRKAPTNESGEIFWVSINAHIVKDEQGNITHYEGTIEDITERKRAEETLLLIRSAVESASDAIGISDPQGHHFYQNKSFTNLFEYTAEELEAAGGGQVTFSSSDTAREVFDAIMNGRSWSGETEMTSKSGRRFPVFLRADAIKDDVGKIISLLGTFTDITERKQAEEELRVSLEKYRVLFESFPLGITISDKSGKIIETNLLSEQLLGITREAHAQRKIDSKEWQIIRKDGTPMPVDEYASTRALRENRLIENVEMGIVKDKGEITWISVTAAPIPLEGYGVAIAYGDITEHKQIADTLSKSEALLIEAQGVAHIGHWELDTSNMTPAWSEEIFHIFSLDPEEGEPSFEAHQKVIHTDDWDILNNAMTTTIVEGIPFDIVFRILRPDKTIRWMHAIGYPKKDSEGRIVSVFGTAQDITDRRLIEEALREKEEHYRILTEKNIAGIYLIQDGLFKYVNPIFCSLYGYTRDELVDKLGLLDLVVEEEREFLKDKIRQRLSGEQKSDQFSIRIRRKDGEIRFLEVFCSYVVYAGEPAVLGTCIDITEARKANEAIKRSREELRSLTAYLQNVREEERIRIAREIHDELGQSLTGIKIDISWLKKKLSNTVEPTDPIQAKIDSLLKLTESTIATTRELSLSLRPGILDDLGLVPAINWQLKRFQEKAGIICMLQTDVAEITIPTDYATALFRISQECLTNISRYANATKVKIALTKEGENLVLEIEDNGKGITTEQIRNPLSLGILGMRERIMGLNGKFSIKGTPKKGTKVRVELPIR